MAGHRRRGRRGPDVNRVFVTRRIPREALDLLNPACAVDLWDDDLPPPKEVLRERVRGAAGLLCLLTDPVDGALLDAAGPGLRVVSQMAVGVDNIDLAACTRRGIPVGHTPGVLTETTADLAVALLLAAARRLPEAQAAVRAGEWTAWKPLWLAGRDVHGATVGIVGLGRIGQAVARRLRGFGCRLLYTGPREVPEARELGARYVDLDTLLAESDFVTLHCPLTPRTRHLIDAATLARMKPTAILVNASRGAVVDTGALHEALAAGRIAGAALDVTDPEPLPPDHPLLALPNCLVLPHIGSASVATRTRMAVMAAENLLAGLRGEPLPHCANPEVYRSQEGTRR
ncbi:2-hydroxyacid dehydrogenase [Deferrisoma palaeochoriense]